MLASEQQTHTEADMTDIINSGDCTPNDTKVVLITGAGLGIGRGTAIEYATMNYRLALVEKNSEDLAQTALECQSKSPNNYLPLELAFDISQRSNVEQVIEATVKHYKRLDVLVNNAGISALTKFDDANCVDTYHKIIDTNMHAVTHLSLAAHKYLKDSKGSIVNVSSMLDDKPAKFKFAYCMSKAAVTMLTKCLAIDFAPDVRVNCVSPGPILSSICDNLGVSLETRKKNAMVNTLIGRIGKPDEVAKMIVYLSRNDQASFMTGTRVLVDGGYTLIPIER